MTKQYFHAFVIGNDKLHGGAIHLAFRVDNEDYYLKKFKRTSHTCHYIELPCAMTKEEARTWIKQEYPDNEVYQQACRHTTSRQTLPEAEPVDRLQAIRDRILSQRAKVEALEQEEQEVLQILDIFQDK